MTTKKASRKPRKASFNDEQSVLREVCALIEYELSECSIEEDRGLRDFGSGTFYVITCGNKEWQVAKDSDSMRELAVAIVKQDLESEPELFSRDFIERHIDIESLKRALRSDLESSNYDDASEIGAWRFWKEADDRSLDIPDDVQKALDIGDEPRNPTSSELDEFAEDMTNDQLRDPMEYLRDIFGDDTTKKAIEIAGIDIDEAAEAAVSEDGPEHFVARYDGNSSETKSGFVYWRTN
jgi:hypothetical protein